MKIDQNEGPTMTLELPVATVETLIDIHYRYVTPAMGLDQSFTDDLRTQLSEWRQHNGARHYVLEGVGELTQQDDGSAAIVEVSTDEDEVFVRIQEWHDEPNDHTLVPSLAGKRLRITIEETL